MEGPTCAHCARPIGFVMSWTVTRDGAPVHQYCLSLAPPPPNPETDEPPRPR